MTTKMSTRRDGPPQVGVYARVSTRGNGQDVGLQLDELRAVAHARGWEIAGEYVDEGVSGTVSERPELHRLMVDAEAGKLDTVLVWRFDRWARSTKHLLESLEVFRNLGVDFVSLREAIDTSTPTGKMIFTLMAAIAEFERDLIVERVQAGVDRAKANGIKLGRPKVEMDLRPAVAMLDGGASLKETAKALGVNRNTLRRRLREHGHWPR